VLKFINLTTTTSGSSTGTPYYKYWERDNYGTHPTAQTWSSFREHSTTSNAVWNPTSSGYYTIVVHVADDFGTQYPEMAGMTSIIGE